MSPDVSIVQNISQSIQYKKSLMREDKLSSEKNDGNENVFFTTLHQYSMKDKKMELFFSLTTSI